MNFIFSKREERLSVLFLILYRYKNPFLRLPQKYFHPVVRKEAFKHDFTVPVAILKFIRNYHPYQFVSWIYEDKNSVIKKKEGEGLERFLKNLNFYSFIDIGKKNFHSLLLKEQRKWKEGIWLLEQGRRLLKLKKPKQFSLVLNLFDACGTGYGITSRKGRHFIIVGPNKKKLHDQVLLHEYLHLALDDFFEKKNGQVLISDMLSGPLRDKWRAAKVQYYPRKEDIAKEYFIRALTWLVLPRNYRAPFIRQQKKQGFRSVPMLADWLSRSNDAPLRFSPLNS